MISTSFAWIWRSAATNEISGAAPLRLLGEVDADQPRHPDREIQAQIEGLQQTGVPVRVSRLIGVDLVE